MVSHEARVIYGKSGGHARARKLNRKRRHEIAVRGGLARQQRARIAKELAVKAAQKEGKAL
jgi:hypothetical protein